MIDVCCAFILKESKILAVQRGPETSHPWKWEFTGGKINAGETAEESIIREIEEELTIRIEVLQPLVPVGFDYGSKQIYLIPFVCKITSGEIKLTEHIALQWLDFEELLSIDWSGADRELILMNQESLKLLLPGKTSDLYSNE